MWVWSVWSKTSPPCRLVSVAGAARAIVPSASRVVVSTLMWLVGRRRRAGCTGYRERAGTLPTVHTRRCAGSALRAPATPLSLNLVFTQNTIAKDHIVANNKSFTHCVRARLCKRHVILLLPVFPPPPLFRLRQALNPSASDISSKLAFGAVLVRLVAALAAWWWCFCFYYWPGARARARKRERGEGRGMLGREREGGSSTRGGRGVDEGFGDAWVQLHHHRVDDLRLLRRPAQ
ncbi:hypothetical protein B0H19DRAFT_195050 [Mycena capillaripes]|nr:hypothetical protein B0H19DRAFT_195050 [Mycena capillaripes]